MCGISGIIHFSETSVALNSELIKINTSIKHRGPDDEGFVFFDGETCCIQGGRDTPEAVYASAITYAPNEQQCQIEKPKIGLAHRRLSILDLSPAGHQPMCTANEQVWIVFNGEIYNYKELRITLKAKGHNFITDTDTEVILAAYQEWGKDCVEHFNGMWAFVIYDKTKRQIWGSRDRTGVKPLYYHLKNGVFVFASEHKALLQYTGISPKLNHTATFDFFLFNELEKDDESFFKDIHELKPSHSFSLNVLDGEYTTWKYYEPQINTNKRTKATPSEDQIKNIRSLLLNAVNLRLRSDVEVGSCLSGGLDSSSIVGMIAHLMEIEEIEAIQDQLKVFTSSFKNSQFDESGWAKAVVDKTSAEWHQVYPTASGLLQDIEEMVYCQDLPIRSTSTYAQFKVMELAANQGVKVLLDGQGADELFAGYPPHNYALKSKGIFGNIGRSMLKNKQGFTNDWKFLIKSHLKYNLKRRLPNPIQANIDKRYFNELRYLNPDFLNEEMGRYTDHKKVNTRSLNEMLAHEYFNGPLKELLKCEDRCSMHYSLESRTAFADDLPLMNYMFNLPSELKIHDGNFKFLLREAMKPYLPEKIYHRKDKMGFVTPNNQWISELKDEFLAYFESDCSGIFNLNEMKKDFDSFLTPTSETENYRVFKFISFAIWHKVFGL